MTNCIFICIFNNVNFVNMFYLLLESIKLYGNLNDNIEILIYTSTTFMNIIKHNRLYTNKIKFEINDSYNNIDKACKARLDLFKLQSINNYEKVLYLDTDILIKNIIQNDTYNDINNVFDIATDNILYVLEEGNITNGSDFWGNTLFGNETYNYSDKSAFTSGILLFKNCLEIRNLFDKINEDIINRPHNFCCYDQPYIIYNAFKYNLFNNKLLKSICVNNDNHVNSSKIIHHFPGGPGSYEHKIKQMTKFLDNLKKSNIINDNDIPQIVNYQNGKIITNIENKTYQWENSTITFLEKCKMNAFGDGYYTYINEHTIEAYFGSRTHTITFEENYQNFISIRDTDSQQVNGKLIK